MHATRMRVRRTCLLQEPTLVASVITVYRLRNRRKHFRATPCRVIQMKSSYFPGVRIFCVLFCSLLLMTVPAAVNGTVRQSRNHFTRQDKAQLIKSILLKQALLKRFLRTNEVRGIAYLSTENLIPSLLPRIRGVKLILLSPDEIEKKEETGFGHFVFKEFKVNNRRVVVMFWEVWRHSYRGAADLREVTYEYRKVNGLWVGKQVSESFSLR